MLLTEFDEEKDWAIIATGYKEIGYEEGIEEGKKEGKKEGKTEGIRNIIKAMLSNGATKETILKLTGITELEFDNIMNS